MGRSTSTSGSGAAEAPGAQRGHSVGQRAAARSALDVMLTDAAIDDGGVRRFIKPTAAVRLAAALARHPDRLASRVGWLGRELARAAAGRSEQAPAKGDRRFTDPAWNENWLLRRLLQAYLATVEVVDEVIDDAELDWRTERQARFAAGNILDGLAPTNFPWSNPAVLRETVDKGGANLMAGGRRFVQDMSKAPRLPASVDTSKFELGGNLALSPGSIVLRTDVFELIHYRPSTEKVLEVPLLFVPPTINRFYILDIAPGRSVVEYLVAAGQQVFMISWCNPGAEAGHFDLDTYARAVLEARDAVTEIAKQRAVHLNAACSGGIITSAALAHLAAAGDLEDAASLTLWVCALDNTRAGTTAALASRELAAAAVGESARKGYLDGRALAGVFAWLRPNDLIWNYVVNNYLLGKDPPAFDILYWNQDSVRLAAGLHRDFIHLALENSLTRPGATEVLGTPIDLSAIDVDSYIVAGVKDHIVPWENAYRSTQLLGGSSRFVLSTSGHIQALVNPPGPASRSTYRAVDGAPEDPEAWLAEADMKQGSWWPDYVAWLGERSGALKAAPRALGSRAHRATAKAPGSYVRAA
ncbi:MAG TPA: alpha/beta fold hydrolase [Solirubrobacteraceae bacterium]|jgi:polyhydroxyalkanoate synthase|nr:alpha/beta fold hydrolase [Solirubrobacteraceae bacterium]